VFFIGESGDEYVLWWAKYNDIFVQSGDLKALKSFYQSVVENLRLQQNGSLVFR